MKHLLLAVANWLLLLLSLTLLIDYGATFALRWPRKMPRPNASAD